MIATAEYQEIAKYLESYDCPSKICGTTFHDSFIKQKQYGMDLVSKAVNNIYNNLVKVDINSELEEIVFLPNQEKQYEEVTKCIYEHREHLLVESDREGLYELVILDELLEILALIDEREALNIIRTCLRSALGLYQEDMLLNDKSAIITREGRIYLRQFVCPLEIEYTYEEYFVDELETQSIDDIVKNIINATIPELVRTKFGFRDQISFNKHYLNHSQDAIAKYLVGDLEKSNRIIANEIAKKILKDYLNEIILIAVELLFEDVGADHKSSDEKVGETFLKWYDSQYGIDVSRKAGNQKFNKPKINVAGKDMKGFFVIQVVKKIHNQKNKITRFRKEIKRANEKIVDINKAMLKAKEELPTVSESVKKQKELIKQKENNLVKAKLKRASKEEEHFNYTDDSGVRQTIKHRELAEFIPNYEIGITKEKAKLLEMSQKEASLVSEINQVLVSRMKNTEAKIKSDEEKIANIESDLATPMKEYRECIKAVGKALVEKIRYIKT